MALHEENLISVKERVELESAFPPSIYSAPPLDVAAHELNSTEAR